jgi:hypothetical protein
MIKVHVAADGTKSFQVYERARVREKSIKVYVGSFASRREAEFAEQQHRVTPSFALLSSSAAIRSIVFGSNFVPFRRV